MLTSLLLAVHGYGNGELVLPRADVSQRGTEASDGVRTFGYRSNSVLAGDIVRLTVSWGQQH